MRPSLLDRHPQRRVLAEQVGLADELRKRSRPCPHGQRMPARDLITPRMDRVWMMGRRAGRVEEGVHPAQYRAECPQDPRS